MTAYNIIPIKRSVEISHLPNEILARLFFRRLWQGYDSGGVSVGRSLRSDLVEAYTSLFPLEIDAIFPFGLRDFANEAKKRKPLNHRQIIFGDLSKLDLVSNTEIGLLCIEGFRVWYYNHKNERTSEGYVANLWKGKFIEVIWRIMPIPFFPHIKNDNEIMLIARVADERVRMDYSAECGQYPI